MKRAKLLEQKLSQSSDFSQVFTSANRKLISQRSKYFVDPHCMGPWLWEVPDYSPTLDWPPWGDSFPPRMGGSSKRGRKAEVQLKAVPRVGRNPGVLMPSFNLHLPTYSRFSGLYGPHHLWSGAMPP